MHPHSSFMKKALFTVALTFVLYASLVFPVAAQKQKTLYQRIGGYDTIAAVVDDFIGSLIADKRFEKFFAGFSVDSKKRIRQHVIDQFCAAAGGPCVYTGRDMKTSHEKLNITNAQFNALAEDLYAALDRVHVPYRLQNQLVAMLAPMQRDVVKDYKVPEQTKKLP